MGWRLRRHGHDGPGSRDRNRASAMRAGRDMLTMIDEGDGERALTVQIDEATIGAELISALESVLNNVEHSEIENFVLQFSGDPDSVTGEFPSWRPGPVRTDMRYFARWDEALSRISRLKAKTFAAYDGRVGAAAVHGGLSIGLRLSPPRARPSLGCLSYWRFTRIVAVW